MHVFQKWYYSDTARVENIHHSECMHPTTIFFMQYLDGVPGHKGGLQCIGVLIPSEDHNHKVVPASAVEHGDWDVIKRNNLCHRLHTLYST